jgi:hypothetical protein
MLASSGDNCIPSAPDITVNEYTVEMGGTGANFHSDVFAIGDSTGSAGLVFTLSHEPVQDANVVCTVNGSMQQPTTDFSVSGTTLTLTSAIASGDVVQAFYLGIT